MKNKTSQELIELCQKQDQEAFAELYKRYYPQAYKLAYHIARSDADARDAAQDAMITVYNHIEELKQPQYFSLWLKRIVVGSCNRIFRKDHHVDYVNEDTTVMRRTTTSLREHDPLKTIHFHSDRELLQFFIGMLSEDQNRVTTMFYFDQLSIREISARLHIPQGTVKSRLFSAKKKLKEMIDTYEKEEQIALDFQSETLGALLATATLAKGFHGSFSRFTSFDPLKIFAVSTMSAVGLGVGILGCQAWNERRISHDHSPYAEEESIAETKPFPSVELSHSRVESAQDAYFSILLLLDQKEQFALLNEQEQEDVAKLYASLREYGGIYYELIQQY